MPVDTRDKRASAIGVNLPSPRLEQNPSGTIAQAGRQFAALVYIGILAVAPATPTPFSFTTWNSEATTVTTYTTNDGFKTWNAEDRTVTTWRDV